MDECELTGEGCRPHLHHVIFKSQGGDDVRANIVGMLPELHESYHRGDEDVRNDLGWHVYRNRPDVQAYINRKRGPEGFDLWLAEHTRQMSIGEALGKEEP